MQWMLVVLVGASIGLACRSPERRGYCHQYAETVSECCAGHEYAHLRAICEQDMRNASSIGGACSRGTRDLYECAEVHACDAECGEQSPDPCFQEQQTMIGVCAESPPPPAL